MNIILLTLPSKLYEKDLKNRSKGRMQRHNRVFSSEREVLECRAIAGAFRAEPGMYALSSILPAAIGIGSRIWLAAGLISL